MKSRRSTAVEELDPQKVEGFSEAQKAYYLGMGYRPFRMASGNVKWLSPALHALRINDIPRKTLIKKVFGSTNRPKVFRRKHRSQFMKFIGANMMFIIIFLVLVIVVVLILTNPQLLLKG